MKGSILTFQNIGPILDRAKNKAERSHGADTMLILNFLPGGRRTKQIELLSSAEEQARYFEQLGPTLEDRMLSIEKAVLVANPTSIIPLNPKYARPDFHSPDTDGEAIVIEGRNAMKTQTISLLQPFVYSEDESSFWGKFDLVTELWVPEQKEECMDLLDCLFVKAAEGALR